MLSGCDRDDILSLVQATTTRAPIIPTFEHGDNLTDEDFYFITECLQDEGLVNPAYPSDFSDSVKNLANHSGKFDNTIYKVRVDTSSPAYYICAYIDEDALNSLPLLPFSIDYGSDVKYFIWHKYEQKNDIPDKTDNLIFMGAYAVYDCYFEIDLLHNVKTNYTYKYFVPLLDGYDDLDIDIASKYLIPEYLYLEYPRDIQPNAYIYVPHGTYKQNYNRKKSVIVDDEGDYCLFVLESQETFDVNTFSFEQYRSRIGERYDEMLPYLKVIENADQNSGYKIYIKLNFYVRK